MGETAAAIRDVAAPPTTAATFHVPFPFGLWFTHFAPHAGKILALVPAAGVVVFFLMVVMVSATESLAPLGLFLIAYFGLFIALLLSAANLLGRPARKREAKVAAQRWGHRLKSSKDWLARGDITQGESDQLQAVIGPAASSTSPWAGARTTARDLRLFVLLLLGAALLVVPISLAGAEELIDSDGSGILPGIVLVSIDVAIGALAVQALRTASSATRAAIGIEASVCERIDALEQEIIRASRARRGAAARTVASASGPSPSFRAYGR